LPTTAEHIYEANWIRDYFDHIQKTYFPGDDGCKKVGDAFKINQSTGYSEDLLNSVGTRKTYQDMMVLFPRKENIWKFNVSPLLLHFPS